MRGPGNARALPFHGRSAGGASAGLEPAGTIAVNTSPVGLFDKSALESMACAVPTVVCNPAFASLMGEYSDLLLINAPDDVTGLRDRLARLLALPESERERIGQTLRAGVIREHSLKTMIALLLSVFETGELPPE